MVDLYQLGGHPVRMKIVTMTELRKNLFQLVDEAVASGEAIVVDRKGARVVIRGEGRTVVETPAEAEARWGKFWAEPPRSGFVDFTVEEFNRWSADAWEWHEDANLDR